MRSLFLVLVITIACCSMSFLPILQPSYIAQPNRPKVAAHRGLSSVFPENTMESFMAAMYQGADFIELDVVLSLDNEVMVSHDVYMSRCTNIADLPQFADRRRVRNVKGVPMNDWWLMDFTREELLQVKIRQALIASRTTLYNDRFTFPTLREVLQALKDFNTQHSGERNPDGSLVGVLLEIKDYKFHREYLDIDLTENVAEILREMNLDTQAKASISAPVTIMSFDVEMVMSAARLLDLPRVQLMKFVDQFPLTLEQVAQYADIAGVYLPQLWDQETQKPSEIAQKVRESGLLMYAWTFQDDAIETQELFGTRSPHAIYRKAARELKLDGIITEFADIAVTVVTTPQ